MDRRQALTWFVRGIGLLTGAVVVGPAVALLVSPGLGGRRGASWAPVGPIDRFPPGQTLPAVVILPEAYRSRSAGEVGVYVSRKEDGELVVYSRSCTDVGCPVTWDGGSGWFYCPCHGGIFDGEGTPVAGPPPRPLHRYENRVRAGVLEVDLRSVPAMT
jgi:menaquinol-cytochrome c reductase iron-sulfur subunit